MVRVGSAVNYEHMKILAIIPARGGSKGIPFKNIVDLGGRPLIAYTIEAAKRSKIFDKIIVSTENRKIENVSVKYGAQVIKRPKKLARNSTLTEPVILHVLEWLKKRENYKPDIIFLLQPTSPLRTEDDIRGAYKKFIYEKLDSLLSVCKNSTFIWRKDEEKFRPINYVYRYRPRRQDIKDQFKENGAIYITRYRIFMKFKNRIGGKIGYYVMSEDKSIEIDSSLDLLIAKQILKGRSNERSD